MAGLLGGDDIDPSTQGLLAMGLGMLNSRGNFGMGLGQGGQAGLAAFNEARQQQQRTLAQAQQMEMQKQAMASQAIQMQMAQQQLAEHQTAQQDRARSQAFLQGLPSPQMQSTQAGMAGGGGPTMANAARMPPVDPMQQMMFGAVKAGAMPLASYIQSMQKDETPIQLAGDAKLVTRSGRELANNPKPIDQPSAIKEYNFAVSQGYAGSLEQFMTGQKRAGASSVNVSMDKGFGDAFAKDAAGSLALSRDQAKSAASNIRTLDSVDAILRGGKVALGPTATFETFGRQIGETLGVGGKDNAEVLGNTRRLIQNAASLAADGAKLLAGQGQITENERALIMRAAGGDIDKLTAPETMALSGALRKVNVLRIQQHQASLNNVGPEFGKFTKFYQVDQPTAPPVDFGGLK
jgi:hypothetical protein